jgi:glucose/mannose-6-phosphate isomerase
VTALRSAGLDGDAVAAVDSTAQAAAILGLGGHLRDALDRVESARLRPVPAPGGVVVAGMGGSAVGGRLAVGALGDRLRRPLVAADGYDLPPWVGEGVLVLCSSYSGGTEETLSCYEQAQRRGAAIVAATTGGLLEERARRDGVPVIPLPTGFQPRAAVGYSLVCALEVAALGGAAPSVRAELEAAAEPLEALAAEWGPGGGESGRAKALARRLHRTLPVITGTGPTAPVAYRWKCQMNENAKIPAFAGVLPEADHNEICGWAAAGEFGELSAVFLEDPDDRQEIARRVELTAGLADAGARTVERVTGVGSGGLQRLLSLVLLGDLVSLYLAVLRHVDPVEVEAISTLKAALSRS